MILNIAKGAISVFKTIGLDSTVELTNKIDHLATRTSLEWQVIV